MKDRCCSRVTKATRHAQLRFKNIYTWTLFEVNSLLTRKWTCSWNAIRFPCILSNLHEFRIFGKLNSTITCIVVCYNYHYVLLWCVCIFPFFTFLPDVGVCFVFFVGNSSGVTTLVVAELMIDHEKVLPLWQRNASTASRFHE